MTAPGSARAAAELQLARLAVDRHQHERARAALACAHTLIEPGNDCERVEAWLLAARLSTNEGGEVERPPAAADVEALGARGHAPLAAEALAMLARVALGEGDGTRAEALLERAQRLAPPGSMSAGYVAAERAEVVRSLSGPDDAATALRLAIQQFSEAGSALHAGRAMLRMASLVAEGATDSAPPAAWLARAQAALGASMTWRDRSDLRQAFRRYGRRIPDHALAEAFCERIDTIDRLAGQLEARLYETADGIDRQEATSGPHEASVSLSALLPEASARLRELHAVSGEVWDLATAIAAERDRFRMLLVALAKTSSARTVPELAGATVEAVRGLVQADCVLLVEAADSGVELVASVPERARPPAELWKPVVDACLDGRSSSPPDAVGSVLRRQRARLGPVLAAPVRSATFTGALYVDKLAGGGHFDETSYQVVTLLGMVVGQHLGMLRARQAESHANAEAEATFETIRDGVISVDESGQVRAINKAAARMLQLRDVVGRKLGDIGGVDQLAALLVPARRLDGAVAQLRHGSVVVTARPVTAASVGHRGVVATLVELDRARRAAMRFVNARLPYTFADIVGASGGLREAIAIAKNAAQLDSNLLITGESGTGKEILAQAIHAAGARAEEPFVGINCAALPRDLLESELFGYERGSFTGARNEGSIGKFELAGHGTLLLDEIGDMPLDMQAKLLRVVQERVVTRLGGMRERPVQARIISTTHRHLEQAVERGTFRLDLLFRLRVLHVHLPPLRERPDDIEPLALHFLRRASLAQRKSVQSLSPAVVHQLQEHDWPGNVRELANVMEREVGTVEHEAEVLGKLSAPLAVGLGRVEAWEPETPSVGRFRLARMAAGRAVDRPAVVPLAEVEKRAFLDALEASDGHVGRAAQALGVSQASFYAKLKAWGIRAGGRKVGQ